MVSIFGAMPILVLWFGRLPARSATCLFAHTLFSACLVLAGLAQYVNSFVVAGSQYASYGFLLVPVVQGALAVLWTIAVAFTCGLNDDRTSKEHDER